jgi:hypothetical protein
MARPQERLDAVRLFEASEAVMAAVHEVASAFKGRSPYPPALLGTSMQPAVLGGFTRFEVEEGTRFLIRLGLLDPT